MSSSTILIEFSWLCRNNKIDIWHKASVNASFSTTSVFNIWLEWWHVVPHQCISRLCFDVFQLEEQQQRQQLSRDRELMKRRSLEMFQKDIQERQREFEQRVGDHSELFLSYTGHWKYTKWLQAILARLRFCCHTLTKLVINVIFVQEIEMQNLEKQLSCENETSRKTYYREFKKVSSYLSNSLLV